MSTKAVLIAVLTASTFLTTGAAFAQSPASSQQQPSSSAQQTAMKDYANLSKDGSKGFQDIALARLAIFDGRTSDAKKFADEADSSFDKAQHDDTVFMKAESDLKSPQPADQSANAADKTGQADKTASNAQHGTSESGANANQADMKKPTAWLPVDGEISIMNDFTANPSKSAAVSDANKSLAKGDRKGAMEKLKLADVDLDIVLAVVPVKQTVSDVHQAAQLIDSGKFYEASQMLRKVQDSARFDVADIVGVPKQGASSNSGAKASPNASSSGSSTTH